ncbi:MAG: sigma 54-interacting transcriptional regulator, partial [Desulfovibrionaceae bacterium]|nr:sigma 54-interacting transcriptional regulator [Desulfovibrionaceae bacterium]
MTPDLTPISPEYDWKATYLRFLNHLQGLAYRCRINNDYTKSVLEFASRGSLDLLGMTQEELLRDNFNSLERMMPAADLNEVRQRIRDSIVAHSTYQLFYRLKLPSGIEKWVWDQGEAVYDKNGEACFLEGLIVDVSEQKFQELALQEENRQLKISADRMYGLGPIIGKSEGMRKVYKRILKAAESDVNVIIYGETGCGKDLVARTIHDYSGRKGSYIPVNCGAIPEALLESEFFGHTRGSFSGAVANKDGYIAAADNGTLFLDEIGELPMHLQVK